MGAIVQALTDARYEARQSALREAAAICNEYHQTDRMIDGIQSAVTTEFRKGEMHAAAALENRILAAMNTNPQPKGSTK